MDLFLTGAVANKAFQLAAPTIENMFNDQEQSNLSRYKERTVVCVCLNFPAGIYEHHYGANRPWPNPFDEIARNKASVSKRTGRDTQWIVNNAPQLLEKNDCRFGGGIACDGYSVGSSGLEQEDDITISRLHQVIIDGMMLRISRALREATDFRQITREIANGIIAKVV